MNLFANRLLKAETKTVSVEQSITALSVNLTNLALNIESENLNLFNRFDYYL